MNILNDFKDYVGVNGLITDRKGGGSLNDVLYTCISLQILEDQGSFKLKELKDILQNLDKCFKEYGLLTRTPAHHHDQEGLDDYKGIINYSQVYAFEIYNYGQRKTKLGPFSLKYVYNNVFSATMLHPATKEDISKLPKWQQRAIKLFRIPEGYKINWSAWLGRQTQFIAHLKYRINISPSLFQKIYWALSIVLAGHTKPNNQDGWVLSWLLVRTFENSSSKNLLGKLASKYWRYRLMKTFPGKGLQGLAYLGQPGEHPITKWWVK